MRPDLRAALAVALLCVSAAVWAAPSVELRIREAIQAREAGNLPQAMNLMETLARERPDDPTVLRILGSTYAFAGRFDAAIATLRRAQILAPKDQDIALALARALLWSGRAPEAALVADGVGAAEPNNPELPALRDAIRNAAPRAGASALNFSQSISAVSLRGRDETWFETVLAASAAVSGRMTLTGEVEQSYRLKVSDTRFSVRLDRKLDFGEVYVGGSVTPHADFREKWSLRAGGELQLSPIVTAILDARHADYGAANVTVIEPAVRLQTRSGGLSLTLRSINLWDETGKHRNGWSIRSDIEAGRGWRLFGGAATYPDTEAGVTRRVRGGYAGVAAPLSGRLTLRLVADHERRVATYSRTGLAIGLGWRLGS